jgi:hypothetical protein
MTEMLRISVIAGFDIASLVGIQERDPQSE